jgi:hypothetical protein
VTRPRGGPLNHGAPALASGRELTLAPPCRWSCGRLPYGDRPYPLVAHDDGPATALAQSTRCQEIRSCGARARGRRPARLSGLSGLSWGARLVLIQELTRDAGLF